MTTNAYRISEIDPSEWTCVGSFYRGSHPGFNHAYRATLALLLQALAALGNPERISHDNGGCAVCGAQFLHGAVVYSAERNIALNIGQDCLHNLFGLDSQRDVLRSLADRHAKAMATRERKAAFAAEYPGLEDTLAELAERSSFFGSLHCQLVNKGELSIAQMACVERELDKRAARAERAAKAVEAGIAAPAGRYTITGTVVKVDAKYNDYGTRYVMTVLDDRGFRVWGTDTQGCEVGDKVRFDARVEPKADNPTFGFYSRPTKFAKLETASA